MDVGDCLYLIVSSNMKTEKIIQKNWFEDKISDERIKVYLEYILSYKRQQLSWYKDKRKKARQNSWKHLLPALIFFGLSLIFPLLAGIKFLNNDSSDFSTYYALGYISLILSTLLLLADRLFIHSKSWIRYTIALNNLEAISSKYYANWLVILPKIESDSDSVKLESKKEAIKILSDFDNEIKEVIKTETDNWKDLFTGQLDEFNKQTDSKLKSKESEMSSFIKGEEANALRNTEVTIEIQILDIKRQQKVDLKLYQNKKVIDTESLDIDDSKWFVWNLNVGVYELELNIYEDEKTIKKDRYLIQLKGDENIHREEFKINTTANNV